MNISREEQIEIATIIIESLSIELYKIEDMNPNLKFEIHMNKETRLCIYNYIIELYTNNEEPELFAPIEKWKLFNYPIKIDEKQKLGRCLIKLK